MRKQRDIPSSLLCVLDYSISLAAVKEKIKP